jgi:hypothetical protein
MSENTQTLNGFAAREAALQPTTAAGAERAAAVKKFLLDTLSIVTPLSFQF